MILICFWMQEYTLVSIKLNFKHVYKQDIFAISKPPDSNPLLVI